ncbi:MAG TPA: biotin/lipoyl-containing protein [Gammaproteobacteria bacterium]
MELTPEEIAEIQRLLETSPYDELTIERAGRHLTLRRAEGGGWIREVQTFSEPSFVSPVAPKPAERDAAASVPAGARARTGLVDICPPLPGAFYRAPKPGAEPFVEVGSWVSEETVIGIIETMKLMNPVPARVQGEIFEICAANGEQVDTAHVLMRVKPKKGERG